MFLSLTESILPLNYFQTAQCISAISDIKQRKTSIILLFLLTERAKWLLYNHKLKTENLKRIIVTAEAKSPSVRCSFNMLNYFVSSQVYLIKYLEYACVNHGLNAEIKMAWSSTIFIELLSFGLIIPWFTNYREGNVRCPVLALQSLDNLLRNMLVSHVALQLLHNLLLNRYVVPCCTASLSLVTQHVGIPCCTSAIS
mgnify:CR=1 FL=1